MKAKFCAYFVLENDTNFEFCAPTLLTKIGRLETPGPTPSTPQTNSDFGMSVMFRDRFVLEVLRSLRSVLNPFSNEWSPTSETTSIVSL